MRRNNSPDNGIDWAYKELKSVDDELLAKGPSRAVYIRQAQVLESIGYEEKARHAYERALKSGPWDAALETKISSMHDRRDDDSKLKAANHYDRSDALALRFLIELLLHLH